MCVIEDKGLDHIGVLLILLITEFITDPRVKGTKVLMHLS